MNTKDNTKAKQDFSLFIDELKRRNDIVDVISLYAAVSQKGRAYWALCPFHGEKTASFSINREGQYYKCFGCGKAGDVIRFVQEIENCTFMDAVGILANRAGLALPDNAIDDEKVAAKKRQKELCVNICTTAARHYYANLYGEQGLTARKYLASRGISATTAKSFGLGLSLGYEQLPAALSSANFSMEDCVMAGVCQKSSRGTYYDALYGRLIVPLIDIKGEVIAFGGRVLGKAEGAKYKNTGTTPIHEKNRNLFGINLVKKNHLGQLPYVIVLEGYMDVISLYQAGITTAVASMGTSLTQQQAKLLKRLSTTVYISYDGDAAGQSATVRGMDILRDEGCEVKVVSLPEKLDPDEYVRKYGAEAYRSLLDSALPLVDYKLLLLRNALPINSTDSVKRQDARRKYLTKAIEILKGLTKVEQESYCGILAQQTSTNIEFLRRAVTSEQPVDIPVNNTVQTEELSKEEKALCYVACCMLHNKPYAVLEQKPNCAEYPLLQEVFDYIFASLANGEKPIASKVFELTPDTDGEILSALLAPPDDDGKLSTELQIIMFEDCVKTYQIKHLNEVRAKKQQQYSALADEQDKKTILDEIAQISQQIKSLQKKGE